MSESPIELRGKGGGVVFQGTQSPSGGSLPGATRILDLGVLDIVALDNGPATIYTPESAADFFALMVSLDSYVEQDVDATNGDVFVGQAAQINPTDFLYELPRYAAATAVPDIFRAKSVASVAGVAPESLGACFLPSADPVIAYNITGNGYPIPAVKPAWQASHGYLEGDFVTVVGGVMVANNAGTSDLAAPAYPGAGSTVLDNDILWIAPTATTQGAIHLYAMVATPAPA